jgi:glyoxylase-like metal-dependent hydrolase (beta-lactamase superfamily II)
MRVKRRVPILAALVLTSPGLRAQQEQNFDNVQEHVVHVRGNIYMLAGAGAGGNIAVQTGPDGILIVDTQFAPLTDKILAAIRTFSNAPIRNIVNTGYHSDHTGGNEKLRKAGSTIVGGNFTPDVDANAAPIFAHERVLARMSAKNALGVTVPSAAWPTDTYSGKKKDLYFNGEGVRIQHMPGAITDGDSIVYFRGSDVIATGDIFVTGSYPQIDLAAGGTINGEIDAINALIDLDIPVYGQEGGTLIIPGRGRLCDLGELVDFREMLTVIRDRVQDLIKKGKTLEQVKVARPSFDYDPEFAAPDPSYTPDMFVESIYKSLTANK